jgi:glycosyltransferase involved in cell wall biosynthesis
VTGLREQPLRIPTLFPHYNTGGANSHTSASICAGMRDLGALVTMFVPASDAPARRVFTRDCLPPALKSLAYKLPRAIPRILAFSEYRFLKAVRPNDFAYVWPGVTVDLYRRLRERGARIVTERINCHPAAARRILDAEFAALGWPVNHNVTDSLIEEERAELAATDFVFSPSPQVDCCLRDEQVPEQKIIPCSYGWDPERLAPARAAGLARTSRDEFTVLFLGLACVRKGIHLLLEAWRRARVKGRFIVAGRMETDVANNLKAQFATPGVTVMGHVPDIAALFRSADVMALPTLEEGGPLVTYEAMAAGLVPLVSPMGAGRIARDGIDSVVLPPHDLDHWANALQRLATDFAWRRQLADNAVARAQEFTWRECARVRLSGLRTKIGMG